MKDVFKVFTDRKALIRMVISGVLFLAVAAPFKAMLSLVPGVTEVRPANMIPPVLGILWGPAAAWGIAIANAISDIVVSHSAFRVWFPGMIINFFFAYLPYRMWYSLNINKKGSIRPKLSRVSEILRFIYICLMDSLVTTVLLALLFEILGFQSYASSVLLLFFNNFDFAIILGVPVILLLTNSKRTGLWVPSECSALPKEVLTDKKHIQKQRFFDGLFAVIGAVGILYYFATAFGGFVFPHTVELVIFVLFLLFELSYLLKPLNPVNDQSEDVEIRGLSIRAKVIIGFLMLSVFFVVIIGVATYVSQSGVVASQKDLWQYIYTVVGISLNIIFLISLVFLKYVELKITAPLEKLSRLVKLFAARDHQANADDGQIVKESLSISTGDEIEELSGSFAKMMTDIDQYVVNLAAVTAEKERIGAELNVATQIQASMLPCIFPAFPDRPEFDIYATMDPAKEVGGDFYDFFMVDERHVAIVVADVSGKGVPAALFMVIGKTLIKDHTQLGSSLGQVFAEVNDLLCEANSEGLFITAFEGVLDLVTGEFVFVNAGHETPFISKAGGAFEPYKIRPGFVLAGMEGMHYNVSTVQLEPGDRIFQYTDGVPEATDSKEELYGMERLEKVLSANADKNPTELLPQVKADIDAFVGEAPQFDDITMLCLEYKQRMTE